LSEIANGYYELLALDNLLEILRTNTAIQDNLAQIIRQQKEAGKVTQLAVNRFEAQGLQTKNLQFDILQKIVETENRLHFFAGRFPQTIQRNPSDLSALQLGPSLMGTPATLLQNRPDIRQAELLLQAAKLDVAVAKANFYPSLRLQAGTGTRAFSTADLLNPASLLHGFAGDLAAPFVNQNAIKANYGSAFSVQLQAINGYEQAVLNGYIDVLNQFSLVENCQKSYEIKAQEVALLTASIDLSKSLFNSARADYLEVLLTQQEALASTIDLNEIKLKQRRAKVSIYHALGGGWK